MKHHMLSGAFVPLKIADRSLAYKTLAVLIGTAFLAVSSWIEVPMYPVPVTMQTFAVTMVGALYGWRLGGLTVIAWLAEAMVGFPGTRRRSRWSGAFCRADSGIPLCVSSCSGLRWFARRTRPDAQPVFLFGCHASG